MADDAWADLERACIAATERGLAEHGPPVPAETLDALDALDEPEDADVDVDAMAVQFQTRQTPVRLCPLGLHPLCHLSAIEFSGGRLRSRAPHFSALAEAVLDRFTRLDPDCASACEAAAMVDHFSMMGLRGRALKCGHPSVLRRLQRYTSRFACHVCHPDEFATAYGALALAIAMGTLWRRTACAVAVACWELSAKGGACGAPALACIRDVVASIRTFERGGGLRQTKCRHSAPAMHAMVDSRSSRALTMDPSEGWLRAEAEVKAAFVGTDDDGFEATSVRYVAGVDLSFDKADGTNAAGTLVVMTLPELEVVYERTRPFAVHDPYVPGFLGVREAGPMAALLRDLAQDPACPPQPQVVLVDGNGVYHPRRCGSATHLGIAAGVPTIGVAKTPFEMEGVRQEDIRAAVRAGCLCVDLVSNATGETLGVALCAAKGTTNPIYVSQGHRISLASAIKIVQQCCKHRVPEPIRQADLRSRAALVSLPAPSHTTGPQRECPEMVSLMPMCE